MKWSLLLSLAAMKCVELGSCRNVIAQGVIPSDKELKSIELRNYVLQPGQFQAFADFMNTIIVPQQESLGGYMLGEFSLKDSANNFFWIRGFADMSVRSRFMKDFYSSDYWKQHRSQTNNMLIDSYNVHLLKPVRFKDQLVDTVSGWNPSDLKKWKGVVVVNYFRTSGQRNELMRLLASRYIPLLKRAGVNDFVCFIRESTPSDYLPQHVYQSKDLLVLLTRYDGESDYKVKLKKTKQSMTASWVTQFQKLVTSTTIQILYPIETKSSTK